MHVNELQNIVLYLILNNSTNLNSQDDLGRTTLHKACTNGCFDVVILLIQHGAEVNINSYDGTRLFICCVVCYQVSIPDLYIMLLRDIHGADISVEREGKTLVAIAAACGYEYIGNYLKGKLIYEIVTYACCCCYLLIAATNCKFNVQKVHVASWHCTRCYFKLLPIMLLEHFNQWIHF